MGDAQGRDSAGIAALLHQDFMTDVPEHDAVVSVAATVREEVEETAPPCHDRSQRVTFFQASTQHASIFASSGNDSDTP
jgi:hypothetical protein